MERDHLLAADRRGWDRPFYQEGAELLDEVLGQIRDDQPEE